MVKQHALLFLALILFVLSGLQAVYRVGRSTIGAAGVGSAANCSCSLGEIRELKQKLVVAQKRLLDAAAKAEENLDLKQKLEVAQKRLSDAAVKAEEAKQEQLAGNIIGKTQEVPLSGNETPKRVILLTSQVSGSSWLARTLNQNPGMHFKEEALIHYSLVTAEKWHNTSWNDYRTHLEKALTSDDKRNRFVGFKLMYDQIPAHLYSQFTRWLNDNSIKVIHLTRNALMRLASQVQKIQRLTHNKGVNLNHVTNETKHYLQKFVPPKLQLKPHIDIQVVRRMEQNNREFDTMIRVHAPHVPMITVRYEDLDGPQKASWFNAINAFLGVEHRLSGEEGDLIKVGGRTCEDRVAELDREYKALSGSNAVESCSALRSMAIGSMSEVITTFWPKPRSEEKARCSLTPSRSVC